jgi:NADH:ubiquinone oxidoreductase subunit 2 (subunit N)
MKLTTPKLVLHIVLVLTILIDLIINGFPKNDNAYKSIGLVVILVVLSYLIFKNIQSRVKKRTLKS